MLGKSSAFCKNTIRDFQQIIICVIINGIMDLMRKGFEIGGISQSIPTNRFLGVKQVTPFFTELRTD